MPHFSHTRIAETDDDGISVDTHIPMSLTAPPFPPTHSITDDTSHLHLAMAPYNSLLSGSDSGSGSSASSSVSSILSTASSSSPRSSSTSLSLKSHSTNPLEKVKLKAAVRIKRKRDQRVKQGGPLDLATASQRRTYFSTPAHRKDVRFSPNVSCGISWFLVNHWALLMTDFFFFW